VNDDQITDLKLKIYNFIFEHGPDAMTLKQAEHAACVLLEAFLEAQGPPGMRECPECGDTNIGPSCVEDMLCCNGCGEQLLP
jgi:hypothetical protein